MKAAQRKDARAARLARAEEGGAGGALAASHSRAAATSVWEWDMMKHVPLPEALRYRQPGAKVMVRGAARLGVRTAVGSQRQFGRRSAGRRRRRPVPFPPPHPTKFLRR